MSNAQLEAAVLALKNKIQLLEEVPNNLSKTEILSLLGGDKHEIKQALNLLLEGSPKQAFATSLLAYYVGFFTFSSSNLVIPQTGLDESIKSLLLAIHAIPTVYSRLKLGIEVNQNGGRQTANLFLLFSAIGLLINTYVAECAAFDLCPPVDTIESFSDHRTYLLIFAALLAGFGLSEILLLPNVSGFYPKEKAGMVSAIIGGFGGMSPGSVDQLFSQLNAAYGEALGQSLGLVLLNIVLLSTILLLYSRYGLVASPYHQLVDKFGLSEAHALILVSEVFGGIGPKAKTTWASYYELAKIPSVWVYSVNYMNFFGGFLNLSGASRLHLEAWGYSANEAGSYISIFSATSSLARGMTGIPLQYFVLQAHKYFKLPLWVKRSILDNDPISGAAVNTLASMLVVGGALSITQTSSDALRRPNALIAGLMPIAIGFGEGSAASFKRVAADSSIDLSTALALVGSLGPIGSFVFSTVAGFMAAQKPSDPGEGYRQFYYVYLGSTLLVDCLFLGISWNQSSAPNKAQEANSIEMSDRVEELSDSDNKAPSAYIELNTFGALRDEIELGNDASFSQVGIRV